jgi:hypothetical protein
MVLDSVALVNVCEAMLEVTDVVELVSATSRRDAQTTTTMMTIATKMSTTTTVTATE